MRSLLSLPFALLAFVIIGAGVLIVFLGSIPAAVAGAIAGDE